MESADELESAEGTGRTVDEAVEQALDELGLERDEVEITVLADGSGDGPARVLVTALPFEDEDEEFEEDELAEDELEDDGEAAVQGNTSTPLAPVTRPAAPQSTAEPAPPRPPATPAEATAIGASAQQILVEMLNRMDLASDVVVDDAIVDDGLPSVQLSIHGEYGGILIGRHGETLGALQFLLGLITGRRAGRRVRVLIDVEGYRERREKLLREMATRAAERAQRYRQPIFMDPMSPAERRVVHMTLQEHPAVTTHSIGEGDSRRVVVSPKQAQRFGGFRTE